MEIVWMGFNMIKPTKQKEYWVTVENKYWNEPKAMMLNWGELEIRGVKHQVWLLNGNKIPSTWEVTWWLELPPAVK